MKEEVLEILKYKYETMDFITENCNLGFVCPLELHCNYSRDQILAALGGYDEESSPSLQAGVKYFKEKKLDAFFITLNKSEKDFSPSTLYEDYAINETLFHWQSQSRTSDDSETGRRYINHKKMGNKIILFVREYRTQEGYPAPYVYLGEAAYESHSGSMPISFVWRLKKEIPAKLMREANKGIV